ncbi:MAG: diguanylate cyclase [Candidatus Atribacteria bacterium]|nr:diguanylate cyclase [Candidatus Atribacteria bacterium]
MIEPNLIYSVVCLASAVLAFSLGFLSFWNHRFVSYARPLGFLLLFCGIYAFGYGFEIMKVDTAWFFLWLRVEYFGIAFIPFAFLWTSMAFTRIPRTGQRKWLMLFWGLALLTLVAVLTNEYHHYYYASIGIDGRGLFPVAALGRGPLYVAHAVVFVLVFFIGTFFYLLYYRRVEASFRSRAIAPVVAGGMSLGGFLIYVLRLIPWELDIGPSLVTAGGCLIAWAIIRAGFLDISPIARHEIFESMLDGVIVTDPLGVVVDFNPAVHEIIPGFSREWLGKSLGEVVPNLGTYSFPSVSFDIRPFSVRKGEETRFYEVRKIPIQGKKGRVIGTAWYLRDITERYRHFEKLREQAEKDELTGIWNRRKWTELAWAEIERARRYRRPLALLFLDIDHFKVVNDTVGHKGGDVVLVEVVRTIELELRVNDLFARLGGEEFAVLLPEVDEGKAWAVAERIRQAVEGKVIRFGKHSIRVTVSIGIAVWEEGIPALPELMHQADLALYKAKELGRNRVVTSIPGWLPPPQKGRDRSVRRVYRVRKDDQPS